MSKWSETIVEKFPRLGRYKAVVYALLVFEALWTAWILAIQPALDAWSRADFISGKVQIIGRAASATLGVLSSPGAAVVTFIVGFTWVIIDGRVDRRRSAQVAKRVSEKAAAGMQPAANEPEPDELISRNDSIAEETVALTADQSRAVDVLIKFLKSFYIRRRQIYEKEAVPLEESVARPLDKDWLEWAIADIIIQLRRLEIEQKRVNKRAP